MKRLRYTILALLALVLGSCGSKAAGDTGQAPGAAARAPERTPAIAEAASRFCGDSALALVERQLECGPRVPGSAGHEACRRLIADRLEQCGADTIMVHTATARRFDGEEMPVANIIARYNAGAPVRILLAAHYDTRPWADSDPDPAMHTQPIPGANDGASGVAVLLELARCLGADAPAGVGVDLAFLDAEDSGSSDPADGDGAWCLGSRQWMASAPYPASAMPAYGILLDMVGGRGARFYHEYFSLANAPEAVMKVWRAARLMGYGDIFIDQQRGAVNDDHVYLTAAGIPTADIIECAHPATGSFPPYWHTMADDLSNIDPRTLEAVGRTVLAVVHGEAAAR